MTQPLDNYENLAGQFSNYLKGFFEPAPAHTTFHFGYRPVIDIIEADPGFPAIRLLDYGCGSGQFAAFLNTKNVSVTGLDASVSMLDMARKNFPDLAGSFFQVADVDQLERHSFDCCTMNFVISELQTEEEMQDIFSRVFGLLNASGKLIILTNNPEDQPEGADFNSWSVGPVDVDKPGSAFRITIHDEGSSFDLTDYFWPKKSVLDQLKKAGFSKVEILKPDLADVENKNGWQDEAKIAPTLIYIAAKPQG